MTEFALLKMAFYLALLPSLVFGHTQSHEIETWLAKLENAVPPATRQGQMGPLLVAIGKNHLEAPYVANSLETEGQEQLVFFHDRFDCFTFVEVVFAAARTLRAGQPREATFLKNLSQMRYQSRRRYQSSGRALSQ